MTPAALRKAIHIELLERNVITGCVNCDNWGNGTTKTGCDLAAGAIPPPEVITFGCKGWLYKIPF